MCVNSRAAFTINNLNPTQSSSTGTCSPLLFHLHPSYLFINYPSLSMHVVPSLSEWSSCNCFSLEELEAAQRNRIETTFAFKMSWDGEEGGSTALLPYTEQHHLRTLSLPILPSLLLSSIVSPSPPYLLPPPPPPPPYSQHGSPCIVFPESSKVDGSLLISAVYCTFSASMDKLICACKCMHTILHGLFLYMSRGLHKEACMCRNMWLCVCAHGSVSNGW